MAHRPKGYGMTAELANKKAAKFDADLANEALTWIADILRTGPEAAEADKIGMVSDQKEFVAPLKDGIILCHLINTLQPDSVKKINTSKLAFKQMENIGKFLAVCEDLGINKIDMFQTVDLFEGQNVPQVINGVYALGRKARKICPDGPTLGPEEASENKREFTEEQLRSGESIIGLQAGSNKGASQAGQNFGKTRAIID